MYKLLIISFAFLLTVACTKQRETQFAQGQGENLMKISEYNGKTFEITTGAPIDGKQQLVSKAQNLEIKAKVLGADSFKTVSYEVNDPFAKKLLGDTPIVGKVNTKYKGLIKVEQNYVKVYKVAKEQDLPLNEVTYAVKMGEELAVPLIGYPITSRVSVDRVKNEYGEKTSTKIEKNQENIANADFFRIDFSRGQIFEAAMKTDVLPSTYLNGEWYYAATVTAASEEGSEKLGWALAHDENHAEASRIKFMAEEDSVKVVNMNVDKRLIEKSATNYKTALIIPIERKSYKVSENGAGLAEQEDTKIHWSKRPYMQLKFDGAIAGSSDDSDFGKLFKAGARLVALDMQDDYFSFVLEPKGSTTRVRYSFSRVSQRNYQGKVYFKTDRRLFGFFDTQKDIVMNHEISRQEDIEKNTFIARFNPNAGNIVFHFTKTTPAWIRPYVRDAVNVYWNQAFKDAGTNLQISLDEQNDVELGDLRYNAINIIENLTSGNLFGFGPSLQDPFTGEIISATTNVHLTPIRESVIEEIKNYVQMKIGRLEDGKIAGVSSQLLALKEMGESATKDGLSFVTDAFPSVKGLRLYMPDSKNPNKYTLQKIDFRNRSKGNAREFDIAIASGNIHKDIEEQCSEVLDYIKEISAAKVTHNQNENKVMDDCSRKLVIGKLVGTLVHEMGHNFGLRHNFAASNDVANFWDKSVTGTEKQVRSSSVMEYTSFNESRLTKPGPYDIAAIRFGYADAIEMKDGSVRKLDTKKSIAANLNVAETHAFKYCTDEDVMLSVDPMCARHDAGTTPLEVVTTIIADFQASYQLYNYRGDALQNINPSRLAAYRYARYYEPLFRFYEEWRAGLTRFLGKDEQYLERLSEKEYNQVLAKMDADPRYSKFKAEYKPAADAIFRFFMEVVAMPDRYCILQGKNAEDVQVESLEKIRTAMYYNGNKSIKSCAEAAQAGAFGSNYALKKEIGQFVNSFRYDLSPQNAFEPLDVLGSAGDRFNAAVALTQRIPMSYDSLSKGLAPSFLDEPDYRAAVENYLLVRTVLGVPGQLLAKDFGPEDAALAEIMNKQTYLKFSTEKQILSALNTLYIWGLTVPGNKEATNQRKENLAVYLTSQVNQEMIQQAQEWVALNNYYAMVLEPSATGSIALIKRLKSASNLKAAKLIDMKDKEIAQIVEDLRKDLFTSGEVATMTVEALLKRVVDMQGVVARAAANGATASLVAEMQSLLRYADKVQTAMQSEQNAAQVKEVLAAPAIEFIKQNKINILAKDFMDKRIEAANAGALYYRANAADIDAQVDLIRSNLMAIGASAYQ